MRPERFASRGAITNLKTQLNQTIMSQLERQTTGLDMFSGIKQRFIELTSKEAFMKEASFALQQFNKNDYLNKATTESKLQAVLNVSQTGLSLNPTLKLAYLVPRYDSGKREVTCCLEPSYQGLVKLITDTGSCTSVQCRVVYKGDEFHLTYGFETQLHHRPMFKSKEVEKVYAFAKLHDGSFMIEVMDIEQIEAIRETSESWKAYSAGKIRSCIWIDHFDEMARKTVIRRLVKYLPKTEQFDRLAEAISLDESDFKPTLAALDYADSLMMTSTLPPEELSGLNYELNEGSLTSSRCAEIIEYLKENQIDPVQNGSYSQGDLITFQEEMKARDEMDAADIEQEIDQAREGDNGEFKFDESNTPEV